MAHERGLRGMSGAKRALGFALLCFPAVVGAVTYTLAGDASSWSNYPPCSGSWSSSGSTRTCSGNITLAAGDAITPTASRTLVALGRFSFAGNNSIGSASNRVNLQTSWGTLTINGSGNVVYGDVLSSGSGNISLSHTTVNGAVNTAGSVTLTGGTVTGNVTGNNGVTATNAVVGGSVTAANGPVSLSGGSVAGSVSSGCCAVSTQNTNVSGGVSSTSNTVSINGGTVSGPISSGGGSGVIIQNATIPSGSVTATGVPINISASTLGSVDQSVNVSGNNVVSLSGNTTVYGSVTAGGWPASLAIDNSSQVSGSCSPNHPRCNQVSLICVPPPGAPPGVTCVCDDFNRASLNPSPIFGANWIVSTSDSTGIVPSIVANRLRLTANTANNAKAATVPGVFPAAGNYISIDFKLYAYGGNGADGVAVALSDYAVPAVPGAFGGSLGYAQKVGSDCTIPGGCPGFAGGWLGIGIDEYGNFANPTEGRDGGVGPRPDSVAVRGSGSNVSGYRFLGTSGTLTPGVDQSGSTAGPGHRYRIVVDHSNNLQANTTISRDTGGGFETLFGPADVRAAPGQAAVPTHWQLSFTGSTGGSNNIHEIDDLRICATYIVPPSGGAVGGFAAIDSAYGNASGSNKPAIQNYLQGHIYTKLMGQRFRLNVAALHNNRVQTDYVLSGSKYVQVKLVNNADGKCVLDSSNPNYCNNSCVTESAVSGGTQVLTFTASHAGQQQTGDFVLNTAYRNLAVVMRECTNATCTAFTATPPACGADPFAVRPLAISTVAFKPGTRVTGDEGYEAGTPFSLTATIDGIAGQPNGYTGVPRVSNGGLSVLAPATQLGSIAGTFAAAESGTRTATSTGANFTYSEVGRFRLRGFNPLSDTSSPRGVYDGVLTALDCHGKSVAECDALRAATWTGVDSVSSRNDCIANSFANVLDNSGTFASNPNFGKYGCNFGLVADVDAPAVFVPHHFNTEVANACGSFTYSGQPFRLRVSARNASDVVTQNYDKNAHAKAATLSDANEAAGAFAPLQVDASRFVSGVADLAFSNPSDSPTVRFTFADKLTAPATLKVRVVDGDGATSQHGTEGTTLLRSGRLRLANVYGYAAPLQLPLELQYWSGNSWITNGDDTCTALSASHFSAGGWTVGTPAFTAGRGTVALTPNASRNVNVCVDLAGTDPVGRVSCAAASNPAMPWLQSKWPPGTGFDNDPVARASFGIFSPEGRKGVYNREMY